VREVVAEKLHCHCLKRPSRRRNLIEDVDAVLVFFDHSLKTSNLTLDPLQTSLKGGFFVNVRRLRHGSSFLLFRLYPLEV
jgi:hypothetical protein